MGIRFRCHQCGHELHVKDFQGGKRSKCPECETRFRIPAQSAEYSIPLDGSQVAAEQTTQRDDSTVTTNAQGTIKNQGTIKTQGNINTQNTAQARGVSGGVAMETLPADLPEEVGAENDVQENVAPQSESPSSQTQPQAIREAPGATWYVRPPAGGQYGPAPANIFCEWLTENRVTRDSLVWRDGWPQWLVANEVFVDYFGPAVPPSDASSVSPAPIFAPTAPAAPAGPEQTVAPDFVTPGFVAPTSLSDRALAARKRQRKKNYMIMIGILTAISIGLVIALVVVLMRNA